MRKSHALYGNALSLVVGIAVGSLIALGIGAALGRPAVGPPSPPPPSLSAGDSAAASESGVRQPRLLLAWASGGLPAGAEAAVEKLAAVRSATTVRTGTDWLQDTSVLGAPAQPTAAIPLEVALIEPREYARFVAPSERNAVLALDPGEAVIARSAEGLRAAAEDGSIRLVDRTLRARSTIDDLAANGYEALLAGTIPGTWTRVDRFLLISLHRPSARPAVEKRIRALLGPGQALRIRAKGETPFLRYGDAVLPQLLVKKTFGEFPLVRRPDGWVEVDPSWRRANIRTTRVPVLGTITCHRAIIPQLRDALQEMEREGFTHLVNRAQYGGCFGPRFIGLEAGGRLSHHTWGIAIDLNVADNAFGTKADQDPRLVDIMERHGFTWGGRWLVPDGMHFEWARFP